MSIDWACKRAAASAAVARGVVAAKAWIGDVDRRLLIALGALLAIAAAVLCWALATDTSAVLDAKATAAVRTWALGTQSPAVASAFNAATADGALTVAEVRELMEVAKAAEVPPGLYQPVESVAVDPTSATN